MTASAPPAIMTSASPRWMARADSPRLWPLVAHAEAMLMLGPRQLRRIASWPARMLGADCRMKKGDILRKPPDRQVSCMATISGRPPRPTPRLTPIRSEGTSRAVGVEAGVHIGLKAGPDAQVAEASQLAHILGRKRRP